MRANVPFDKMNKIQCMDGGCQQRGQEPGHVSVFKKMPFTFTFTNNQSSYPPTSTINTLLLFSAESVGKSF